MRRSCDIRLPAAEPIYRSADEDGSAVGVEDFTGHEAGERGAEEEDGAGDLVHVGGAAEGDGGGAYALIFEQVNQLPESSGIGPIVDGAFKGRGVARTSWAAGIAKGGVGSREEVSTDVAAGKLNGLNGFQAGCADRKA